MFLPHRSSSLMLYLKGCFQVTLCASVVFTTLQTNCARQAAGRSRLNLIMSNVFRSVYGGYRNVALLYVVATCLYIVSSSCNIMLFYLLKARIKCTYNYLTSECGARRGKGSSNFPVTCVLYIYIYIYRVTHGSRTVFKKKVLGRFSTWNGFICTKIKVKTCHLN